jgi:predicted MFS family arabinose efflux permease
VQQSAPSLSRDRDFRLVAGSVALSAFGDWVAIVALGLQIKDMTGSGWAMALLWICLFGPSVAVAGHAGWLVDRMETTRLLAGVCAVGAVVATAAGLAGSTPLLLGLTVVLGLVLAISQPAEFALVPAIAGRDRVQDANGRIEAARFAGFGLGPLVGALLFSAGGPQLAMAVDGATFVVIACAALALRVRREPDQAAHAAKPRARDGITSLLGDPILSLGMLVAFGSLCFMSAIWVAEVFFVEDVLGEGRLTYGLWLSLWTAGMALGALLVARRVATAALAVTAFAAVAVQGAALGLPAAWLSLGLFLGSGVLGGVAHGVKNVMFRSLIHLRVPDELHGRAFAGYNAIRNSAELGAFAAGGLLVTTLGPRLTLGYAGALSALVGVAGLITLQRQRRRQAVSSARTSPVAFSAS